MYYLRSNTTCPLFDCRVNRIVDIPEEIPEGLPEEDQIAIRAQVGKIMVIQDFNNDGAAELEFVDDAGHIHTIWIDPDCLAYIGQNM